VELVVVLFLVLLVVHLVVVEMEILQTMITLRVELVDLKEILVVPEITGIIIHIKDPVVAEVVPVVEVDQFLIQVLKVDLHLVDQEDMEYMIL
jgi:hypothetical protein